MRCPLLIICDSATIVDDNLFDIKNGGRKNFILDGVPAQIKLSVLMQVEYEFNEAGEHDVAVRLIDSSGQEASAPIISKENFPMSCKKLHLVVEAGFNFLKFDTYSILMS